MTGEDYVPRSQFYRLWLEGVGWELAEYEHRRDTAATEAERKRYTALVTMKQREGRNVAAQAKRWDTRNEEQSDGT